ncbi:MAG: hypothetical protein HZA05_05475 [Nitrospirae bacterium]|nr:hypothetical protein [Nitrospirota bacterium]
MPELPFYRLVISPYSSLERRGVKFPLWKRGIKGDFNNRPAGAHSKPLCAHPALWALAGSQAYRRGLHDEELISGWANVQANNYWSSSTYANNTTNGWNVNMNDGNVNANNKTNTNYVWPVRAGEWESQKISPCPSLSKRGIVSPPLEKGDAGGFLFSFENLYHSYLKCRRNKRNTINALRFEINAEENLLKLSEELEDKTYQPIRSVCFIVEKPKMREIIAADFQDRVVHHALIERLEAIYEPIFIYDSYACRKEKGLHKAVERVKEFIRRGSENGRKRLYFIHLDIRNFFMTIDKEILYRMLEKKVKNENLLYLAHAIIFHNPTEDCIIKGEKNLIKRLPPHKSLFYATEDKGLPIGNLTSQFFANVYLNELDQYAKHILKCRHYVRYCDDFLILDRSPERLEEVKKNIGGFVEQRLKLSLNEKHGKVLPVSNGIDFLGYIIRQDYTLVRRRVVNNLKEKLNWFEERLILIPSNPPLAKGGRGDFQKVGVRIIRYDYELLEKLKSVIASYLGHLKWADTYRLRSAIFKRYGFLKEYFSFDDGRVKPLYRYSEIFPSVRSQHLYYANRFRGLAIFFQVGCFYEFYDEIIAYVKDEIASPLTDYICQGLANDNAILKETLNLKKLKQNNRGAIYGFPVRLEGEYVKKVIEKGMPVVIIKETDKYIGRTKERLPVMKIVKHL